MAIGERGRQGHAELLELLGADDDLEIILADARRSR